LARYEIRLLGELQTFCGIQVQRDREAGIIWLSQASYIEQLGQKYASPKPRTKPPSTPLPLEELVHEETAQSSDATRHRYAQTVGSIGYVATATRPDISKAHSKLAEFLTNPTTRHLDAAYQTVDYLVATKDRALCYNASISTDLIDISEFYGASDASFADHRESRRSSQGYIFYLFGSPIDWKATIQRCVTKSTTEAELIAASAASTELIWWWRIFDSIKFDPGHERLLYCDNQQTIRLLTSTIPRLKTSARHIDIHHHWLRQEALSGNINISYISSNCQPADGLTKLLPRQKHENWISILNFKNLPVHPERQEAT
jgi:hypothetical protein